MRLLFFTACGPSYEHFLLPYILSSMEHNEDSGIEIIVANQEAVERQYAKGLDALREYFPKRRIRVRGCNPSPREMTARSFWSSLRFIQKPGEWQDAEMIYIGDVDILILERDIFDFHTAQMERTGLCFSNMKRTLFNKLSGLHVVRPEYYTKWEERYWSSRFECDESTLFRIVKENICDPNIVLDHPRPQHGYHLSPNRTNPLAHCGWGIVGKTWGSSYQSLRETAVWKAVSPHFDPKYKGILSVVDKLTQEMEWNEA